MIPASKLASQYGSRGLLLDTNLFLLFAVGRYQPSRIATFKRTSQYTQEDYAIVAQVVNAFRGMIITTPHILSEASNFGIGSDPREVRRITVLLDIMKQAKEIHVAKDDIFRRDHEAVRKFGVTDAAIIALARDRQCLVISDDFPLCGYLTKSRCHAMNLNHLRSQRWFT